MVILHLRNLDLDMEEKMSKVIGVIDEPVAPGSSDNLDIKTHSESLIDFVKQTNPSGDNMDQLGNTMGGVSVIFQPKARGCCL